MTNEWVVLVEAERVDAPSVLTLEHLDRLLELLEEHCPTGLWSPDRYALQIIVPATSPEEALLTGLAEWRSAVARLDLPEWRLVRVEVKTPAELEAEHRASVCDAGPSGPSSQEALRAAYLATRRLVAAKSRREVAEVLAALAMTLGATIVKTDALHPFTLPLDLSADGRGVRPIVEPLSLARLDLEEVLPAVMLDAARVLRLLDSVPPSVPLGPRVPVAEVAGDR